MKGRAESARVVIGVPVLDGADSVAEALESLLTQTYRRVRFVLIDDRSEQATTAVVTRYVVRDERLAYERTARRIGPARARRRAFELATERHPDAEFFAWGNDHDVWHPRWLETLVRRLDLRPDAAMAYSRDAVLEADATLRQPMAPIVDTSGMATRPERLLAVARASELSSLGYGLFRTSVLGRSVSGRAGSVLSAAARDRLLIGAVALHGQLVEVPQALRYRRSV